MTDTFPTTREEIIAALRADLPIGPPPPVVCVYRSPEQAETETETANEEQPDAE